jgi:hypothetical protein
MGATASDAVIAEIRRFLAELATALLERGITPKRFAHLAREAFVNAAANTSQFSSGKINYSKVAALTGLPRAEVRRLLNRTSRKREATYASRTPAERVVQGWLTDERFLTDGGRPKPLKIDRDGSSFTTLLNEYAGDVSKRAVLDELIRKKLAIRMGAQLRLRSSEVLTRRKTRDALSRVMPALVDSIRIASTESSAAIDSSLYRLRLAAGTVADLAMVRERCLSSLRSLLYGLRESLDNQLTLPTNKRSRKHTLTVTVLLSEARPRHRSEIAKIQEVKRGRRSGSRNRGN